MTNEEIKKLINTADEDLVRKYAAEWAVEHEDFCTYITHALNPPANEIDFAEELARVIRNNTVLTDSRYYERIIVDWSHVLYRLIEPWANEAEAFSTERLLELVEAMTTQVGSHVQEDDFMGDDWNGDDYTGELGDIMGLLGHLSGLLLIRDDLTDNALVSLQEKVRNAQAADIAGDYVRVPYNDMLQMIQLRLDAGEVTIGIYDTMINANYDREAGEWVCRKVDFIRSMGLDQEAQQYMEANISYPAVCLKLYHELTADEKWSEALSLLDKAHAIKKGDFYWSDEPNWLEMKYELIKEHGDRQSLIDVLIDLFHQCWDEKYYRKLKEMVDQDKWSEFYHQLLKCGASSSEIERAAPFLIMENEFDWLYGLLKEHYDNHPDDYRTIIAHANDLRPTHEKEMQGLIVRSFRGYAASRYAPGQKVNSEKYTYFRQALSSLSDLGYPKEQRELVEYFLQEYRRRPSLVHELESIKFQDRQ